MAKQYYKAGDVKGNVVNNKNSTFERGISTGFKTLDEIISFKLGYSTLLHAHPHTGKSIFSLDVLIGIAEREPDKKIAVYSPEFRTREEMVASVVQQKIGKAMYGQHRQDITDDDYIHAIDWVDEHFIFLERPERTKENPLAPVTISDVFRLCRDAEMEYKCKINILFIDPANYISRSSEEAKMNIQDYVLHLHDTIADFSLALNVHTILSSHCRDTEMITDKDTGIKYYPIPYPSDVMGGQSNYRGGYQIIALWKHPAGVINKETGIPYRENAIEVICQKAKPMGTGTLGKRTMYWNPSTHKIEEEIAGKRYSVNEYNSLLEPQANTLKASKSFDDDIF